MKTRTLLAAGVIIAVLAAASVAQAGVIADVRANYVAGTSGGQTTQTVTGNPLGLADTAGAGVWNFYRLDYNVSGDLDNPGYDGTLALLGWGGSNYAAGISTVTDGETFDSMIAAEDELAWHGGGVPGDPYNNAKRNTVIRWTAGATAPSTVDLAGHIRLPHSGWSTKNISIYKNNVELWSYTAVSGVDTSNDISHDYSLTGISISSGDTISYVLQSGSGGRAAISAQVIPEPATFGMIGAAAIAMLLRRRFRG